MSNATPQDLINDLNKASKALDVLLCAPGQNMAYADAIKAARSAMLNLKKFH